MNSPLHKAEIDKMRAQMEAERQRVLAVLFNTPGALDIVRVTIENMPDDHPIFKNCCLLVLISLSQYGFDNAPVDEHGNCNCTKCQSFRN